MEWAAGAAAAALGEVALLFHLFYTVLVPAPREDKGRV